MFLLSAILLFTLSYQQTPLPYSDYNSANALLTYLLSHAQYYSPNSLFFQFAWYISQSEVNAILAKMTDIYNKYGLNGVFLILDQRAGIADIRAYTADVIRLLESNFQLFRRDYVYEVVLQYLPDSYSSSWSLDIAISTGGSYARSYLPDSACDKLVDTYGPTLKHYTSTNMLALIRDIDYVMDQQASSVGSSLSFGEIILYVVIAICILACCGGGGYYTKRRYDSKTTDEGGGIHVTSGHG